MIHNSSLHSKLCRFTVFNNIFKSVIIPTKWKIASIILIPKTAKNSYYYYYINYIREYRPIYLLPFTSKLLEKIIATSSPLKLEGVALTIYYTSIFM